MQLPRVSEVDACVAIGSHVRQVRTTILCVLASLGRSDSIVTQPVAAIVLTGRTCVMGAKWDPTGSPPARGAEHRMLPKFPFLGENGGFDWFVHSGEVGVAMVCCGRAGPAGHHPTWVLPVRISVLTDRKTSHSLEPQVATMTCSKPLILPDAADYPQRMCTRQQADPDQFQQATWRPKHQEVARNENCADGLVGGVDRARLTACSKAA